ncbi:hypothetical protein TSAR_011812 [Trichomalopsis sarcophagae]|uniref:C2H2-type domain-containing protein n=1 Tax=Trichomalopsis sarcophagae TaxID=543379 RepID=A0A232F6C5_9HYME|nr:hypothetical protein TSAR_011812 [Trichomalopsis sarcophagae]
MLVSSMLPQFYAPYMLLNHPSGLQVMPHASSSLASPHRQKRGQSMRREHVCTKCGKSYVFQQSLNRHRKWECGLEPRFRCPYCSYKSKQQSHVKEHVRRKHDGKRVNVIKMVD